MRVVLSIEIDRPADLVFRAFADIDFVTRVDPNTLSATLIRGKPFSAGASYDMVFLGVIRKIRGTYTFTQYDPPEQFTVDVGINIGPGSEITSFETVAERTKVTWDGRYRLKWFMIPVYFIMRAMVIRKGNKWLGLMKAAIESGQYDRIRPVRRRLIAASGVRYVDTMFTPHRLLALGFMLSFIGGPQLGFQVCDSKPGDLNGDGLLDFIAADHIGAGFGYFMQMPGDELRFAEGEMVAFVNGSNSAGIVVEDFNGDASPTWPTPIIRARSRCASTRRRSAQRSTRSTFRPPARPTSR